MNYFEDWNVAIAASFQNLWAKIVAFVPEILGALLVLVIGLLLAEGLSKLARKLVDLTKVDTLLKKFEGTKKLKEAGLKLSFAALIAWIVKWFIIIVTLIAVVDILKLEQINTFLKDVAIYVPNVVVAVVILAIGIVVGQFIYDIVQKSAKASHVTKHTADTLAAVAKWAIVVFALLAALVQLGVATNLIEILFTGLVAMLALAFGLAFGLGGKEHAAKWLDKATKSK
ncbi:hypothetical protein KJ951_04805 [Patescibacteria group bacterium]|nr:hypothetical protein [Patescibacteria group bacterium]MBU1703696.1 hypothetical protein [Patescibacteria group bacterium]MBU1953510.1 hypothetical protein [Patescibacteria group bacterium]